MALSPAPKTAANRDRCIGSNQRSTPNLLGNRQNHGLNENTVKHLTYALGEAGIGIQTFSENRTYYPQGGRKRNLKKFDESSVQSIE